MVSIVGRIDMTTGVGGEIVTEKSFNNLVRAEVRANDQERDEKMERYRKRASMPLKTPMLVFIEEALIKEKARRK